MIDLLLGSGVVVKGLLFREDFSVGPEGSREVPSNKEKCIEVL